MAAVASFSGLSDMKDFLSGLGTDFFDSVAFDDDDSPTKIVCKQDSHTILEVTLSGTNWTFTPYIADGTAATSTHIFSSRAIETAYKFSGGAKFISVTTSGNKFVFAIGQTSSGKTGFLYFQHTATLTSLSQTIVYPTCFGDYATGWIYSSGYKVAFNLSATADRTILHKIPVMGALGSNDYFTTISARDAVQFAEAGQQKIGGQVYGCVNCLAFTDEEDA